MQKTKTGYVEFNHQSLADLQSAKFTHLYMRGLRKVWTEELGEIYAFVVIPLTYPWDRTYAEKWIEPFSSPEVTALLEDGQPVPKLIQQPD
ncbi:MAG: hypothetical protein EOP48_26685 [Sphingobacteriales bacterium]|nr:MAG: hypothetical protein EOP48_26685 [Sphingobacteriales bacterium]